MSNIIERKKTRFGDLNYILPSDWWSSSTFGISKTIKPIPSYSYYNIKEKSTFPVAEINRIIKVEDFEIQLPITLKLIADEIERSKYLMELEEDWDDDGGGPIKFETWKRAITFIVDYTMWLYDNRQHFVIDPPQINPGPGTSIDLLWRNEKYRLLVNISDNSEQPVEYYGDNNYGKNSIKGKLETGPVQEFFASWLKDMKK